MTSAKFEDLPLNPDVLAGIYDAGYPAPTDIQVRSVPAILQRKDAIVLAPPGAGKTAAYLFSILNRLGSDRSGFTRALVILPTPETAEQAYGLLLRLGNKTGLIYSTVYGEYSQSSHKKEPLKRPDIVIGCPDRLLDSLWKGRLDVSGLEILVIDEADRMFSLGFLPDIFNILACISDERQTLLFSATLPENLKRLSRQFLKNPVMVEAGESTPETTAEKTSPQVKKYIKTELLKSIINREKNDCVLVFTRTVAGAGATAEKVKKAGYGAVLLQGSLSKNKPSPILQKLGPGSIFIVVVSGAAASTTDTSNIFRILNYEKYGLTGKDIPRTGRTGKIDKDGNALTLVAGANAATLHTLEQLLEKPLEYLPREKA